MRSLEELVDNQNSAWPGLRICLTDAVNPVEILPVNPLSASESLVAVQVTTRSTMGALVFHTGGALIDRGWLRLLGSGHPRLPRRLPDWNRRLAPTPETFSPDGLYLVADDVLGGFFTLNSGRFDSQMGTVHYFSPETLGWESLGFGYTDFVEWCCAGQLARFYKGLRWSGWEKVVSALGGDRAIHCYPPPFTKEFREGEPNRKEVPIEELYRLYVENVAGLLAAPEPHQPE